MLQVCLNGGRDRSAATRVPVTPQELGDAAEEAVAAGARDIHLHPRNDLGIETMEPVFVDAAVAAVRASAPWVPVGVATGEWTEPDPERRAALVRAWSVLPDHASVNWHEDGAETVAEALLDLGVGVEAGVWSGTAGAARLRAWPHAHRLLRVLAEVTEADPATALRAAERLLRDLADVTAGVDVAEPIAPGIPAGGPAATRRPLLLHGADGAAWPVLRMAATRSLDVRIGLEDVLLLPDGSAAPDNAALVVAALDVLREAGGE